MRVLASTEPPDFNTLKPFHIRLLGLNSLKYCSSTEEVDRSAICTLRPIDLSKTALICMPEIRRLLSSRARLLHATGFEWGFTFKTLPFSADNTGVLAIKPIIILIPVTVKFVGLTTRFFPLSGFRSNRKSKFRLDFAGS